jgi:hypothetical protein
VKGGCDAPLASALTVPQPAPPSAFLTLPEPVRCNKIRVSLSVPFPAPCHAQDGVLTPLQQPLHRLSDASYRCISGEAAVPRLRSESSAPLSPHDIIPLAMRASHHEPAGGVSQHAAGHRDVASTASSPPLARQSGADELLPPPINIKTKNRRFVKGNFLKILKIIKRESLASQE